MGTLEVRLKIIIVLVLWAVTFYPIYPDLIEKWFIDSDNSHGVLVPLISGYLIWIKRDELSQTTISNSIWGGVILAFSLALYIIGYLGAIAIITRLMIVFSLVGLVLFIFGKRMFSIIAFPLFFLIFMVPVPDTLYNLVTVPLQLQASKISSFLINAVSIPVYREGNILYFAQTQLEVAEACSGLRSMMAFLMLSFLFVYLMDKDKNLGRILIILSAFPLAFFTNILRVTGTGILAHFYGGQIAQGFLHEFSGFVVFAFGFILFVLEYLLLNKIKS